MIVADAIMHRRATMNSENQPHGDAAPRAPVVRSGAHSIEDIMRHVDPAPDRRDAANLPLE